VTVTLHAALYRLRVDETGTIRRRQLQVTRTWWLADLSPRGGRLKRSFASAITAGTRRCIWRSRTYYSSASREIEPSTLRRRHPPKAETCRRAHRGTKPDRSG